MLLVAQQAICFNPKRTNNATRLVVNAQDIETPTLTFGDDVPNLANSTLCDTS